MVPRSASLKHAAIPGVYMSLNPNDPTLWTGVIFVRSGIFFPEKDRKMIASRLMNLSSGPYASAILRFQIRFPPSYPDLPPLVNFSTDVFHPLIVPLTTYTFSTGSGNNNPISAADEGRLPPGGFSLRHGFPEWFGRGSRKSTAGGASIDTVRRSSGIGEDPQGINASNVAASSSSSSHDDDVLWEPSNPSPVAPVAKILSYISSTFDDATVLDSVPLEAAGNPGAWHAWRAHRSRNMNSSLLGRSSSQRSPQARLPGDWHWGGIWAKRARDEIEASQSEATLFGNSTRVPGDEMVCVLLLLLSVRPI